MADKVCLHIQQPVARDEQGNVTQLAHDVIELPVSSVVTQADGSREVSVVLSDEHLQALAKAIIQPVNLHANAGLAYTTDSDYRNGQYVVGGVGTAVDGTTFPIIVKLDGRELAKAVVRDIPKVIRNSTGIRNY